MEYSSYSPQMCHTCPLECYGRNISRPGASLYLLASAAAIAGFALIYALNPDAARSFIWFPVFPFAMPIWGERISKRLVRNLPKERIRHIYLGLAVTLSFFFHVPAGGNIRNRN
jgi:hypothetical protein